MARVRQETTQLAALPRHGTSWLILSYQFALAATALGIALGLVLTDQDVPDPLVVVGLCAVGALAERGRVNLGGQNLVASISALPTVFAAAIFGPLAAILVAASSYLGDFPPLLPHERRLPAPYLKWGVWTSIRAIYGGLAGLMAQFASSHVGSATGSIAIATAVAVLVVEPLDVAFAALTAKLRGGSGLLCLKTCMPVVVVAVPLYAPVVGLLGVAYTRLSPWTLALFFVPALAAQYLYRLYQTQVALTGDLVTMNKRLEGANVSFATALVATLDARDRYTAGHSAAVSVYARDIAEQLRLPEDQISLAQLAGLVHDIGKIGLPAGLLEKPGALTLDERQQMEKHPVIGERILNNVETYQEIADVVRHHHERLDGNGYPDGLTGEQIPLLARIITVADAYNAMTSDRPYRDAMPSRIARLRLNQSAGTQFDPDLVAAFEAVLAAASEEYRMGVGAAFRITHVTATKAAQASDRRSTSSA